MLENYRKLNYILYNSKEFYQCRETLEDISFLFQNLIGYPVNLVDLSVFPACHLGEIEEILRGNQIFMEDSLLITSKDSVLQEAKSLPLAVLAYKNPQNQQELYGTDFLVEGFEEVDYFFLERVFQRKHNIPWRVIDTNRCYLREMTLEDLPELYRLYEGKGITDYIPPLGAWEEEVEYTKAYIEKMYPYFGYGMWVVINRDTHELMGRAGINPNIVDEEYLLEMGYIIGAEYQRKGYAREVCQGILEFFKQADTGFDRVHCFVQKGNQASLGLLRSLDFTFEREQVREGKEMLRFYKNCGDIEKFGV